MSLPINIMMWILAILPIVTLLILMVKFQLGAAKAAPIGLAIAIVSSILLFKSGITVIGIELIKAAWNALNVILVIFTAILMYEVTNEAKAFRVLKNYIERIAPNELIRVIGVGIIFASFLQGVTGFGVPVAVAAPLLIGLGVKPVWAVIMPLLGHCWAGTFGTLAIAWTSLIMQIGVTDSVFISRAAFSAACFIWILNFTSIITISWFYGGKEAVKKGFLAILLISIAQGGGQLLFSQINQVLSCFIPGCIGIITFLILCKSKYYNSNWEVTNSPIMNRVINKEEIAQNHNKIMNVNEAFIPYYVMTLLTITILLIPTINNFLGQWAFAPTFRETVTGYGVLNPSAVFYSPIKPFVHPGNFLFISAFCGFFYYRKKGYISIGSGNEILKRALKKTIPSSLAVISLIMMSRVMGGTGQTTVLALGTVKILGKYYSIMAPFIGLLGSFITGSNMSSNILFGDFQLTTSKLLGLDSASVLGAHTAGGAVGTAISPGNILLGTTTAGIMGEEGKVLKKILPFALVLALVFGLILYVNQTLF